MCNNLQVFLIRNIYILPYKEYFIQNFTCIVFLHELRIDNINYIFTCLNVTKVFSLNLIVNLTLIIIFRTYRNIPYHYQCTAVVELEAVPHSVTRRMHNIPPEAPLPRTRCRQQLVWYFWISHNLQHMRIRTTVSAK